MCINVCKNTSKCNEMFLILLPGGAKNRKMCATYVAAVADRLNLWPHHLKSTMTNEKGQRAAFTYFGKGPRENKSSFGQPTNQWSIYSSLI